MPDSQIHHLVRECFGLFVVVGDEEGGDLERVEDAVELAAHLATQAGVEGGERFVEKEKARLPRKGACEGDALLLAAGNLTRTTVPEFGEVKTFQ